MIFYEDCVVESEIYLQMREDTAAIWLHVLCFHIQHRSLWKKLRAIWKKQCSYFQGSELSLPSYIWIVHFKQGWDSTFCFSWSPGGGGGGKVEAMEGMNTRCLIGQRGPGLFSLQMHMLNATRYQRDSVDKLLVVMISR